MPAPLTWFATNCLVTAPASPRRTTLRLRQFTLPATGLSPVSLRLLSSMRRRRQPCMPVVGEPSVTLAAEWWPQAHPFQGPLISQGDREPVHVPWRHGARLRGG
jgi:hypothetical protein